MTEPNRSIEWVNEMHCALNAADIAQGTLDERIGFLISEVKDRREQERIANRSGYAYRQDNTKSTNVCVHGNPFYCGFCGRVES